MLTSTCCSHVKPPTSCFFQSLFIFIFFVRSNHQTSSKVPQTGCVLLSQQVLAWGGTATWGRRELSWRLCCHPGKITWPLWKCKLANLWRLKPFFIIIIIIWRLSRKCLQKTLLAPAGIISIHTWYKIMWMNKRPACSYMFLLFL